MLAVMSPQDVSIAVERIGAARTHALRELGITRRDLRRAVEAGLLVRLREGVYASDRYDPLLADAARHGGAVACVSVLRRRGLWVLDDEELLHVWVGPNGRAHAHEGCSCVTHREIGRERFGELDLVTALAQTLRCQGQDVFFAALESALRKGMIDASRREDVRRAIPAGQRWLVDFARTDADSGLESLVRLRLHRLGIAVTTQVTIRDVGRVDFLLDDRIILEIDGKENHDGESNRHKDLVRDAAAAARGYETLRFDYAQVVHAWPTVESAILARLADR